MEVIARMILIVEDNVDMNKMVAVALQTAGYETESVYTGMEGMTAIRHNSYDLILLDMMLPYKSGDEILKELRTFSDTPVIVVSAKDMVGTKVDMLKMGADDYITKPFDLDEVIARVECNLRRSKGKIKEKTIRQYKELTLDKEAKQVMVGNHSVELTAKEYLILELLLDNPSKVFSKANLYETVWEQEYYGDDNAIKTHMSNLRNKIKRFAPEEEYIETLWGIGYRLAQQHK